MASNRSGLSDAPRYWLYVQKSEDNNDSASLRTPPWPVLDHVDDNITSFSLLLQTLTVGFNSRGGGSSTAAVHCGKKTNTSVGMTAKCNNVCEDLSAAVGGVPWPMQTLRRAHTHTWSNDTHSGGGGDAPQDSSSLFNGVVSVSLEMRWTLM